ncbi:MAG TPA: peptide chain release factor N(5)-glutamine methyltransferase [Bacteroidota bacterium]|nr:peptide chain release factor N(5)-glutamine methyltransferase [Bacteroidota bacterium]
MTLHQDFQSWTIRDLMKFSIDHLQRHGFDEARLTVELLLSHALQFQRIDLYTHFDQPLKKEELKAFKALFERRLHHEPVQYIVGSAGFMGMQFHVDPRVLIPRPETETLVEQILLVASRVPQGVGLSMFEVGTGSGNIAVSTAKLDRRINVATIEKDKDAIDVARMNAEKHSVADRTRFVERSVFDSLVDFETKTFNLLVSNPPYIAVGEWEKLAEDVRAFEPREALTDGGDGLKFYRRIGEIGKNILLEGGSVLVEVGYDQSEEVASIFRKAGYADISVTKDLQGIPRVVSGKLS